jgi:hypothetical protein
MARLPQLIDAVSKTSGRDRSSVEHWARAIREAGLITTTKRGVGAAEMTTRDAANLLIGLCGADTPRDAAKAVHEFRSLKVFAPWSESGEFFDVYERIKAAPDFGVAIEELIDGILEILSSFRRYADEAFPSHSEKARSVFAFGSLAQIRLEVKLARWPAHASIRVLRDDENHKEVEAYRFDFLQSQQLLRQGSFYTYPPEGCDTKTIMTFGLKTVLGAALAVHGEPE